MKQGPNGGPTNTRSHCIKFCPSGDRTPGICAPLVYRLTNRLYMPRLAKLHERFDSVVIAAANLEGLPAEDAARFFWHVALHHG
jgi:hypothetical protein